MKTYVGAKMKQSHVCRA